MRQLITIAKTEPQLAYSSFTFGLSKRWLHVMRTTPCIADLLKPLEEVISKEFLPCIVDHNLDDTLREVIALPTRFGGLGVFNPCSIASNEFDNSRKATAPLVALLKNQTVAFFPADEHISGNYEQVLQASKAAKVQISKSKEALYKQRMDDCLEHLPEEQKAHFMEASKKGSSLWLTCLPISDFGFVLNKCEFIDAISLRYNFPLTNLSRHCGCGKDNDMNHAMICPKGGYVHLRHNQVRNLEAKFLSEVCHDVALEPTLLPLSGERFNQASANTADAARLDVSARGVWRPMDKVFFDVRIFHPTAQSNLICQDPFEKHEMEKKRTYNNRVIEVEKATFVPLVFSTTGAMGKEAAKFHKQLATLLAQKRNLSYSEAIWFVRCRLRFCILRTALVALRGYRGTSVNGVDIGDELSQDVDLTPREFSYF